MEEDRWFERVAAADPMPEPPASASLKSKVYSAAVATMASSGGLLDLRESRRTGRRLCVFEHSLTVLPARTGLATANPCRVCHARVLGERMTHAPIFWPGCPYSEYHNG